MPRAISIIIGASIGFAYGVMGAIATAWGISRGFIWWLYEILAAPMVLLGTLMERNGMEVGCMAAIGFLVYFAAVGAVAVLIGNWALMAGVEKLADIIKERNAGDEE